MKNWRVFPEEVDIEIQSDKRLHTAKIRGQMHKADIDIDELDITDIRLRSGRGIGRYQQSMLEIRSEGDRLITEIQLHESQRVRNALLHRIGIEHEALNHFRRVKDRNGNEWVLKAGDFPTFDESVLNGQISKYSYVFDQPEQGRQWAFASPLPHGVSKILPPQMPQSKLKSAKLRYSSDRDITLEVSERSAILDLGKMDIDQFILNTEEHWKLRIIDGLASYIDVAPGLVVSQASLVRQKTDDPDLRYFGYIRQRYDDLFGDWVLQSGEFPKDTEHVLLGDITADEEKTLHFKEVDEQGQIWRSWKKAKKKLPNLR